MNKLEKTQRRLEAERQEQISAWKQFCESYHVTILTAIYTIKSDHRYKIDVKAFDEHFHFTNGFSELRLPMKLPEEYDWDLINTVGSLLLDLRSIKEELEERERIEKRKKEILSRFTDEELKLVGLK